MPACTNGVTRFPLSLTDTRRTHCVVNMPRNPNGRLRPHGTLPQSDIVLWSFLCSIGSSLRSSFARNCGDKGEILPWIDYKTYLERGTLFESVVGLGRYSPEKVSGELNGLLRGVRNTLSSAKAKAGLTVIRIARIADTKVGLSER